jgi:hypothetical protein
MHDFITIPEAAKLVGKSIHTINWLIKNNKIHREKGMVNGRQMTLLSKPELIEYYGIDYHEENTPPVQQVEVKNTTQATSNFSGEDFLNFQDKLEKKIAIHYEQEIVEKKRVIERLEQQKESLQNIIVDERGEKGAMAGELNFLREKILLVESETVSLRKKTKNKFIKVGYIIGSILIFSALILFIFAPIIFRG